MVKKFHSGTVVFDHWRICQELDKGDFGELFSLSHDDGTIDTQSQLKIVSVPQNLRDFMMIQASSKDMRAYVQSVVSFVMEEVALMTKLNGNPHIVHYYDHKREEYENGLGFDVLIRTEYLPRLGEYVLETPLSRGDVLRLGVELCKALEECHENGIIHRDIRPEHIYVTKSGSFKLGDFGVPCVEASDLPSVGKGNPQYYMAPELSKGEDYDHTVDIYALSLVIYQLLNKNRMAFIPDNASRNDEESKEKAKALRMNGAVLPPPYFGKKGKITKVLARAAQHKSSLRYATAKEFREDLEGLLPKKEDNMPIFPYVTPFTPPQFGKISVSAKLMTAWFG